MSKDPGERLALGVVQGKWEKGLAHSQQQVDPEQGQEKQARPAVIPPPVENQQEEEQGAARQEGAGKKGEHGRIIYLFP